MKGDHRDARAGSTGAPRPHIPAITVVGVGTRSGVRATAVRELLDRVVAEHGLDAGALVFATVARRADEPGLLAVLGGAELVVWSAVELAAEPVPHPSARVAAATGTPSVAEAAALRTVRVRCGATAELLVPKCTGHGVTLAVARAC